MSLPSTHLLLIYSAKQVIQICTNHELYLSGKNSNVSQLSEKLILGKRTGISIVIDLNGIIEEIDYDNVIFERYGYAIFENYIDAREMIILPGFIDAHTHPVWAGDRINEFNMKIKGMTYQEIAKAGGGIFSTVLATQMADEESLYTTLIERLLLMARNGTTTIECKTGYGLQWETEEKLLRVLKLASENLPIDLSITYLAAHAIPKNMDVNTFTKNITDVHIPNLAKLQKNHEILVHNIDAFCDTGYFDIQSTFEILKAGHTQLGLNVNFHGEELTQLNSFKIIEQLRQLSSHKSVSFSKLNEREALNGDSENLINNKELPMYAISHLEELSEDGIEAMKDDAHTVAILLPMTKFNLKISDINRPPARKLIDSNVPVALGTDFNPGVWCTSMPIVMYMAALTMDMTLEECLISSTLNAAASLNLSRDRGSIERGKLGDLIIIQCDDWRHLIHRFGDSESMIRAVIKRGQIIHSSALEEEKLNAFINPLKASGRHGPWSGQMIFASLMSNCF